MATGVPVIFGAHSLANQRAVTDCLLSKRRATGPFVLRGACPSPDERDDGRRRRADVQKRIDRTHQNSDEQRYQIQLHVDYLVWTVFTCRARGPQSKLAASSPCSTMAHEHGEPPLGRAGLAVHSAASALTGTTYSKERRGGLRAPLCTAYSMPIPYAPRASYDVEHGCGRSSTPNRAATRALPIGSHRSGAGLNHALHGVLVGERADVPAAVLAT